MLIPLLELSMIAMSILNSCMLHFILVSLFNDITLNGDLVFDQMVIRVTFFYFEWVYSLKIQIIIASPGIQCLLVVLGGVLILRMMPNRQRINKKLM